MRKIRAERPSNPQQNRLGMESNASTEADVATIAGAVCLTIGGDASDKRAMRAVSFFGPDRTEAPAKAWDAIGASRRGS